MFSSRTRWQRGPNRLARRLAEAREAGRPVIDLTLSNPTLAGFRYPDRELREALTSDDVLTYTPHPLGLPSAREAVAAYYRERGLRVDTEHLLLTAGSSEAYSFIFRLLCEPGDTILIPSPSYPLFDYLADLNDLRPVRYRLAYGGEWHVDTESIRRVTDPRCRAIVLVHPNNPTGTFVKTSELDRIAAFARARDMALIVDEVFIDYPFESDARRAGSTAELADVLTFTINGLSKTAGLPHLKLGWLAVSGPPENVTEALERLAIIADAYLTVGTPVQRALPRLLATGTAIRAAIRERTRRNYGLLADRLGGISLCSLLPAEGGWYATMRIPATRTDEEWALRLLDGAGVHVHPGFLFDFTGGGYFVVSLLTPEEDFREGVGRILRIMDG